MPSTQDSRDVLQLSPSWSFVFTHILHFPFSQERIKSGGKSTPVKKKSAKSTIPQLEAPEVRAFTANMQLCDKHTCVGGNAERSGERYS
jgi:hypothetical protein